MTNPFAEPAPDSTAHFVAYVAAQPGTIRAWRCKRCPGVWKRWADINGPCEPNSEPIQTSGAQLAEGGADRG